MFFADLNYFVLPQALPLIAALVLSNASQSVAQAPSATPSRSVHLVSDHEGRGILECLTQKRNCGRMAADSWCRTHGHGPALAFGRADDITSSAAAPRDSSSAGGAVVACAD